jgi:hypothetical protein
MNRVVNPRLRWVGFMSRKDGGCRARMKTADRSADANRISQARTILSYLREVMVVLFEKAEDKWSMDVEEAEKAGEQDIFKG